jgi:hypothetical protein
MASAIANACRNRQGHPAVADLNAIAPSTVGRVAAVLSCAAHHLTILTPSGKLSITNDKFGAAVLISAFDRIVVGAQVVTTHAFRELILVTSATQKRVFVRTQ